MDTTSGVGRVISSFLILVFTLLFSLLITAGFNLSVTAAIIISFVFMVMVIEDYMYLTIDIRILGFLAFAGIFASTFGVYEYFLLLLLGLLYYRIVYLFLIKYAPPGTREETDVLIDSSKAVGFLPSLACGLAIYGFYRIVNYGNHPDFLISFYDSCAVLYAAAFEDPLLILTVLLPFILLWMYLERKRYKAEKNNQIVIPLLGDGDVYVLAVWLGVLGLADMIMVMFVSVIVQALAFIYRDKVQNNN